MEKDNYISNMEHTEDQREVRDDSKRSNKPKTRQCNTYRNYGKGKWLREN